MKSIIVFLLLYIISNLSHAEYTNSLVIFKNNSDNVLTCQILNENTYIPFIRLQSNQTKQFTNFNLGSKVRCSIKIDANSSTVLTYFSINYAGVYELLKEYVECKNCGNGSKVRWGTIVVDPNGNADYNRL